MKNKFPSVGDKISSGGRVVAAKTILTQLPEIREYDPTDVQPSILLIGGSGTGKTHAIGSLIEAGKNVLVLAVEAKLQTIAKYRPKTIFISEPIELGDGKVRAATVEEQYNRLLNFITAIENGQLRTHNDTPFDVIAIDGILELGDIFYTYWKRKKPITDGTGKQNTYAMWDNIADRAIDFLKACQKAAGLSARAMGYTPIGIVATIGEEMVRAKTGEVRYVPLFPGQKALPKIPYAFEAVIRTEVRNDGGVREFVMHTIGTEEFAAKTPDCFEAEVIDPNFGEMYDMIIENYKEVKPATTSTES